MDSTVCEQEQNLVLVHAHRRPHVVSELGEKRAEHGWATEFNLRERLSVGLNDALDASNVWVRGIAVNCEAVADILEAHMVRNAPEAEDREASVVVVRLNDAADVHECCFVLVFSA